MYHVARRMGVILVCCGLVFGLRPRASAEESSTPPQTQTTLTAPADIEAAIRALTPPIESERLTQILDGIAGLTDTVEQQQLQELLDARMQQVMEAAPPAGVIAPSPSMIGSGALPAAAQPLSDEEMSLRIQSLKLGPEATADDLRARDDLVTAVIAVSDPLKRDRFFQQLEERERQAQTAVYRPTEPAHQ